MSPEAKRVALLLAAIRLNPETTEKFNNASTSAEVAAVLSSITVSESDVESYDKEIQSISDDQLSAASGGGFWADFGEGVATGAVVTATGAVVTAIK
jgi:hypothetical protein